MCISKPQKVLSFEKGEALVEFMGRRRKVRSPFPLAKGDYILCQTGLVVKKISKSNAKEMLKEWSELNDF
jgi:hydrogenase assembly chaperone HypC/HupF